MPALLFDLDGTMLETDALHRAVFTDMMAPYGIAVDEPFYMAHVHGRLNADFFAEFRPGEDAEALSQAKEAEFRRRLPRPYPAMPGVLALLERGRAEGWPMAVVTNAMRLNAEAMLGAIGAAAFFEVVVIGEECPAGKPDPYPYAHAMALLGVHPAEAIAFEDSPSGLRSAAAAGARVIGLRSALGDAELRRHGAHATIAHFEDPALETELRRLTGVTP